MSDEVMMKLVRHGLDDKKFRQEALDDLDGTLGKHGYVLEPHELEAVRAFHGEMQGKSDEEVAGHIARRANEEGC